MTIRREQSEIFNAPSAEVIKAIRLSLGEEGKKYRYANISETNEGFEFRAVIKPSRLLFLSTEMTILVDEIDSKTKIIVRTKSQWFILGDVFDFYGGYIRDVLDSLRHGFGK